MRIVALSGSLRSGSFNTALLHAAADLAEAPVTIAVRGIGGIPVYDGDLEQEHGIPEAARSLKEAIASASGLLIATPEYNQSLPGALKNAIDWCTRPPADIPRVFGDKPVALCGATPGQTGTVVAQGAWLPVFRTLGMRHWPKSLLVRAAHESFENGSVADAKLRERLEKFVAGFADFCRENAGSG